MRNLKQLPGRPSGLDAEQRPSTRARGNDNRNCTFSEYRMSMRPRRPLRLLFLVTSAVTFVAGLASSLVRAAEHPYLLWTKQEAAQTRKRIESEPWAKQRYEQMLAEKGLGQPFRNLFRYQGLGDKQAGDAEKKYLLKFIGTLPDRPPAKMDQDKRHYDNYEDAVRYDVLYDELTPEQHKAIEDTFRVYVNFQLHEDKFRYGTTTWLPNM